MDGDNIHCVLTFVGKVSDFFAETGSSVFHVRSQTSVQSEKCDQIIDHIYSTVNHFVNLKKLSVSPLGEGA